MTDGRGRAAAGHGGGRGQAWQWPPQAELVLAHGTKLMRGEGEMEKKARTELVQGHGTFRGFIYWMRNLW